MVKLAGSDKMNNIPLKGKMVLREKGVASQAPVAILSLYEAS